MHAALASPTHGDGRRSPMFGRDPGATPLGVFGPLAQARRQREAGAEPTGASRFSRPDASHREARQRSPGQGRTPRAATSPYRRRQGAARLAARPLGAGWGQQYLSRKINRCGRLEGEEGRPFRVRPVASPQFRLVVASVALVQLSSRSAATRGGWSRHVPPPRARHASGVASIGDSFEEHALEEVC
jgi:hypothetical protein